MLVIRILLVFQLVIVFVFKKKDEISINFVAFFILIHLSSVDM